MHAHGVVLRPQDSAVVLDMVELYLQCYSTLLGHSHSLGHEKMIKVGVVAKIFARFLL